MRKFLHVAIGLMMLALIGTAYGPASSTASAHTPDAEIYTFPANDRVFPEGIALHPGNGDLFVGSTANGAVYRGNVRGKTRTLEPFLAAGSDGRTDVRGMKVDPKGRLFIAGGQTNTLWMYDAVSGRLLSSFYNGVSNGFVNDVAVAPDGAAYFTDSFKPYLYRIAADAQGVFRYELWHDLTNTIIRYGEGFNLNGIVVTPDGKYLIVVQSNTGKLFRIATASKDITEIALAGGDAMTLGDGLLLEGQTLYVVRNRINLIVQIKLAGDYASGQQIGSFTDPSFAFTTTIAREGDRLFAVNSQFNRRGPDVSPALPFSVSSVRIP